jgi:hypothetical protein
MNFPAPSDLILYVRNLIEVTGKIGMRLPGSFSQSQILSTKMRTTILLVILATATAKNVTSVDDKYICDATAGKCVKTSSASADTEAECEKICKPWKPPALGPMQHYEVIYDTIPHETMKRTHYNGTYWCDLSANSFREDLRKGDNWKVLEERDIQHGNKKWFYNAEINECHEVSNPGTAGCL